MTRVLTKRGNLGLDTCTGRRPHEHEGQARWGVGGFRLQAQGGQRGPLTARARERPTLLTPCSQTWPLELGDHAFLVKPLVRDTFFLFLRLGGVVRIFFRFIFWLPWVFIAIHGPSLVV